MTILFQCRPINRYRDPAAHANAKSMIFNLKWVASFHEVAYTVTLCLPFPLLWRLQINMEHQLQVGGVFLIGGLQVHVLAHSRHHSSLLSVEGLHHQHISRPKMWEFALSHPWSTPRLTRRVLFFVLTPAPGLIQTHVYGRRSRSVLRLPARFYRL